MRVKVCGLRRVGDAERALALGATHLGVVLAADSPRRASAGEVRAIVAAARGVATVVLVFRGEPVATVVQAARAFGVGHLQCHGYGPRRLETLRAAALTPLPVRRVGASARRLPRLAMGVTARAPGVLDGGRGGAGSSFDWALLGARAPRNVLIAGGIGPDNVEALLGHRPWGIDVCSGVEVAPGEKDHGSMCELFAQLQGEREVQR